MNAPTVAASVEVQLPPDYTDTPRERGQLIAALTCRGLAGGQVERITTDPISGTMTATVTRDPSPRPGQVTWQLGADVKPTQGLQISAYADRRGMTLVAFDPYAKTAVVAAIPPATRAIRDRLAAHLKCDPWALEILPLWAVDADTGEGRLDSVQVLRHPAFQTADKRVSAFTEAIAILPGGSAGWRVEDDPQNDRITLRFGRPERLPATVPLAEILPDSIRVSEWASIPLGVGPDGTTVGVDLLGGPHALVVGPTGSGKTVELLAHAVGALARGHQLALIDPTKAGLDFIRIRPWCTVWADDLPAGQAAIERIYAEVARRKAVLQRYSEVKWSDLPVEVRRQENIHPMTVIIDEFGSLVLPEPVPKALDKDHPYVTEANERNSSRAIIQAVSGRIAREARFAGIHLAIGIQRPDAAIVGGELRSNLTSAIQLAAPGKPLSIDALRMVFGGDVGPQAAEALAVLDDGRSRGLAVMAAEGGSARGFRVAYAPAAEIPEMLERIGVPLAEAWVLNPAGADEPRPGSVIPRDSEVIDTGTVSFTLDDLEEADGDGVDPFAKPTTKPAPATSSDDDSFWG